MKKIILDTNALMAIAEFKIDIFSELERICDFTYDLYILEGTIKELKKIMEEQRQKFKRAAKLALAIVKAKGIKKIASSNYVDDVLVELSKKGDLILTQDIELKKRLTKPYLTIRQKKRVVLMK
ncbi:DNA-binding protein [Candidatus Woesearchaeota archaeon]|nr:DNA-binding protein [Candidatus Woesearchaeota archaeon]MBT5342416.1 DNA-binding protein [Candidatus Woesearchaeota archaeon]